MTAVAGRAPSNATIEELFDGARSARIVAGPGHPGGLLLEVRGAELSALRETLRIVESEERFHCMCLGDLAVETHGFFLSMGRLSFHHGVSVRHDTWCSDAALVDGPALLRFLAERAVPRPLAAFEAAAQDAVRRAAAREAWVAASVPALGGLLDELERGPCLVPGTSVTELGASLSRVRGDRSDDELARALLAWLASGIGPWSGYPSYEQLPLALLRALPMSAVVAVATNPVLGDASVAAAARFFGSHEMVTSRRSALGAVPDAFFARARVLLTHADDRARHDHASRVASEARRPRGAPYSVGDLEVLGEGTDGVLSGLCAEGDTLLSSDVSTVVRFEPASLAALPVADAGGTHVCLSRRAPLAWACARSGIVADRRGVLARGEDGPMEIDATERAVAWVAREAGGGRALRAIVAGDPTVRTIAVEGLLWCLALDDDHAYVVEGGWNGPGRLRRVSLADGRVDRVVDVPVLGPSMGSPRLVIEGGEVLVTAGDRVLAIDGAGRARRLIEAGAPIHAIAADADHVALVVGKDGPFSIVAAARRGGVPRPLGSLPRAPYHRHALVIARGRACVTSGERIVGVPLDR